MTLSNQQTEGLTMHGTMYIEGRGWFVSTATDLLDPALYQGERDGRVKYDGVYDDEISGPYATEYAAAKSVGEATTREGMEFIMTSERRCRVRSASGNSYTLAARVPDDEPPDAPVFVWSCDCPAGRHGRDCKHVRELVAWMRGR